MVKKKTLLLVMATFFHSSGALKELFTILLPSVTLFCLARSILLTNYACNSQGRKLIVEGSNTTMLGLLFSIVTVDNDNGTPNTVEVR